jgi:hypothetical protein
MVEEVFPHVPVVQLVFTIPKIFRKAFLFKRSLYGDLSRAAYAATLDFFREHFPAIAGAVPGMVVAPQSFGSLLNFHPHWHSICSLGVFDQTGAFHPAPSDLDFSPLEGLFRERVFKALLENEATTEDRVTLVRSWVHSGFNVDSSRRLEPEDRQGLQSLLEYMERAPVSLERLEYRSDGLVHYRGHYHPGLGRDHQLLPAVDFLALVVPHVFLRWEVSIRTYGAISTTIRKRFGWIKTDAPSTPQVTVVEPEGEFLKVRRRSWARLIARTWLEDPSLCPSCGKEMKVLAAITSPAQDDVIEKILRARKEWDPPWLKARSARGPPETPGLKPATEADWIDPPPLDDGSVEDWSPED